MRRILLPVPSSFAMVACLTEWIRQGYALAKATCAQVFAPLPMQFRCELAHTSRRACTVTPGCHGVSARVACRDPTPGKTTSLRVYHNHTTGLAAPFKAPNPYLRGEIWPHVSNLTSRSTRILHGLIDSLGSRDRQANERNVFQISTNRALRAERALRRSSPWSVATHTAEMRLGAWLRCSRGVEFHQ